MKKRKIKQNNLKFNQFISKNDPLGSYTGNSIDGKTPIQDADDL